MELLTTVKAFVRLHDAKQKKTKLECTKNSVLQTLFNKCDNHLDRVKVMDMVMYDLQNIVYNDYKKDGKVFVNTEKALDLIKAANLKTA